MDGDVRRSTGRGHRLAGELQRGDARAAARRPRRGDVRRAARRAGAAAPAGVAAAAAHGLERLVHVGALSLRAAAD